MADTLMVPPSTFLQRTAGGFAVQMDTSVYEGFRFDCGCGAEHPYDRQEASAIRELGGMRLVVRCPLGVDALTCVKVKGFPIATGFETLFATRSEEGFVAAYLDACERDAQKRGSGASLRRRNRWVGTAMVVIGLLLSQTNGVWAVFGWVLFGFGALAVFGTMGTPDAPPQRES